MKYGEKFKKALEVLRINLYYPLEQLKKEYNIGRTTYFDAKRIVKQELKSEQNELKNEPKKKKNKSTNKPDTKTTGGKHSTSSPTKSQLDSMSIKAKLKLFGETLLDNYLLSGQQTRSLNKAIDILMKPEFIEQGEIVAGKIYWTSETPPYKRPEFLYDHQLVAMELMDIGHLLWQASRQLAGKTTAGLLKDFEDMLGTDNYTIALIAPTVPLARELLFKWLYTPIKYQGKSYTFYEMIKPYLLKDPNADGYVLKNGSRLMIISLKYAGSQGRTIDVIHIEELDKLSKEQSKREALAGAIGSIRANDNAKIRIFCNMLTGFFTLLKSELFKFGRYFNIYLEDLFALEDDYSGAHTIINEDIIVESAPKLDEFLSIFYEVLVNAAFAESQLYNVEDFTNDVFNPDKIEIAYGLAKVLPQPRYVRTTMGIDPGGKVDAFACSIYSLTNTGDIELRWIKRYYNAKHTAKEQAKEIAKQSILYKVEECEAESSAGSPWSLSLIEHYVIKYSEGKIKFRYEYVNFEGPKKYYDKNNFVYLFKILLDYERLILHERDKEERALHHQIIKYIVNKSESSNNPDDLIESSFHGIWILLGGMDYVDEITERIKSPTIAVTRE